MKVDIHFIKMDYCYNILHFTLLLLVQFKIGNAKTLSVNSHLLNSDSGNREKFTIKLSKSNFEAEQVLDHPLKREISRRFRRALKDAVPAKTKVTFYNHGVFQSLHYPCFKFIL